MATNTFIALDKVTVGTATPSITFSSIPSTYTDLVVVCANITNASTQTMYVRFNGDTTTNYSATYLSGNGSSASSARQSNQAAGILIGGVNVGLSSTVPANAIIQIQNYANTTTFKTALSRYSLSSAELQAVVGMWRSTSAITSMDIRVTGGNFAVGSTFSLYGIAAEGTAYATGGIVTSDANYYYHTFLSSGTFTPKQSLSCDIMVVAGGGGGARTGGGGGAGGFRVTTSNSLTAQNYTCTIGAGGAGNNTDGGQGTSGVNSSVSGSGFSTLTSSGGGGAAAYDNSTGLAGGSGGGGGGIVRNSTGGAGNAGSYSPVEGYAGGQGTNGSIQGGGGGGGAGAVGAAASGVSPTFGGNGGVGSSAYSSWGAATNTGQNSSGTYYYAGGGGGGSNFGFAYRGLGGLGGGGDAGWTNTSPSNAVAGTANTGGGGGAGAGNFPGGAAGGSGLVIVRYAKV